MAATMTSGTKRVAAMSDFEHSVNDVSSFQDTRRKLNHEESSDTIFECQDGKEVFASKLSLMSRWAWFNDVASAMSVASSQLKVPLPDIASPTLEFMLEFLRTGKMPPLNFILAVDIVRACRSKYFDLQSVEESAMSFLKSRVYGDSPFGRALSLAEFATDGGTSNASLVRRLPYVFGGLRPVDLRYLSENGLRFWLDNTKRTTLFSEYLRFRVIIIWCATHASPAETVLDDIDKFLPNLSQMIAHLQVAPSERKYSFDFENLKCLLKERQRCLAGLLEKVNFVHIQSVILDAVVEPLVVPLSLVSEERPREAYKKAYRYQALPSTPKPPQYIWEHGGNYSTDGSVITKSLPGMGLARFPVPAFQDRRLESVDEWMRCAAYARSLVPRAPASQDHGVYEWSVVVVKPCPGYCEIGFLVEHTEDEREQGGPRWGYRRTVSGRDNGYCLKITPKTSRTNHFDSLHDLWDNFENNFVRSKVRVNFRLDLNECNCYIAINHGNFLLAWESLPFPGALYFPAVCLGSKTEGQVRIELLRGFGMV